MVSRAVDTCRHTVSPRRARTSALDRTCVPCRTVSADAAARPPCPQACETIHLQGQRLVAAQHQCFGQSCADIQRLGFGKHSGNILRRCAALQERRFGGALVNAAASARNAIPAFCRSAARNGLFEARISGMSDSVAGAGATGPLASINETAGIFQGGCACDFLGDWQSWRNADRLRLDGHCTARPVRICG